MLDAGTVAGGATICHLWSTGAFEVFHASSARVAVSDVDGEAALRVARELDGSVTTSMGLNLDVRRKEAFEEARDRISASWGRTDIAINNAGYAKRAPVQDISVQEFDDIVAHQHAQRVP